MTSLHHLQPQITLNDSNPDHRLTVLCSLLSALCSLRANQQRDEAFDQQPSEPQPAA